MKKISNLIILVVAVLFSCCAPKQDRGKATGKLFIIGGGNRTDSMMNELLKIAGLRNAGYVYILPMASSVPDSSIIWAKEDFSVTGINTVSYTHLRAHETGRNLVCRL